MADLGNNNDDHDDDHGEDDGDYGEHGGDYDYGDGDGDYGEGNGFGRSPPGSSVPVDYSALCFPSRFFRSQPDVDDFNQRSQMNNEPLTG